ncbi:hypothetical protein F4821DRAFT_139014 [Hypoxylon rubiginosum]|uniref:Uncharacterized protein n=1 Tax=Hypoxylon rubiginosum TaxID=110542 RepID=A0ACC0D004_9PEZI|nr:hypothetical protein F4821DRAFT_139014 [Hypoxylon rubiginosum]
MPFEQTSALILTPAATAAKLTRRVAKGRFYEAMARVSIIHGLEFQPLDDISSSVTECFAEAKLIITPKLKESKLSSSYYNSSESHF